MNGNFQKLEIKKQADLSEFVFGQVQPQSAMVEDAVIGAILIQSECFQAVGSILTKDSFYSEVNSLIFSAMVALNKASQPIDLVTVTEELRKNKEIETIGGAYYLVELSSKTSIHSVLNVEYHARILIQYEIKRAKIVEATTSIRQCYDDSVDAFDLLEDAAKNLDSIQNIPLRVDKIDSLQSIAATLVQNIEKMQNGQTVGISTGYYELDGLLNGFHNGELTVIAGRPSMGKSMVLCNLVLNAALGGYRVGLFSLEMDKVSVLKRMVTAYAEISNDKIKGKNEMTANELSKLHHSISFVSELPVEIDDTPAISLTQLRAKCWKMNKKDKNKPIQIIFIDYLQLMKGERQNKNGNREQEISTISRGLKALAKDFNVPVIALSQLSRSVESRGGSKKPQLSDLRESGAIEQDADNVHFIYRPEYYGITEDENGDSTKNVLKIITAKQRDGATGETSFRVNLATQKMSGRYDYETPTPSVTTHQSNIITGVRGTFREGADPDETETVPQVPINESDLPF